MSLLEMEITGLQPSLQNESLAGVAHELRNQLASIRNAVEILQVDDLPEREFHFARDVIGREVERMTGLVDELVDWTHTDHGKPTMPELGPVHGLAAVNVPRSARSLRILVVDDNTNAADCLGRLLRKSGHKVTTANDGVRAVTAAAAFRPQVVLLDVCLPRLDGYQAARRIRQQPGGAAMKLIAVTGCGQEEEHLCCEAGFDHYLTKPIELGALQTLLAGCAG